MLSIDATQLGPAALQNYLQYAIAPRPICFASTVNAAGDVNLSPFSFFNLFGTNPPVCVFSPARRVRDNTTKHTLDNVREVPECVINIVSYSMVQQTSLASTEYGAGVNEFVKAGLTMLPSTLVRPPRVAEAPVQLECTVQQVLPLGSGHGAGNLVIAEIKRIHIQDSVLDADGRIDQEKMDLVARLGGDWYCRVTPENLFKVPKPLTSLGIGVDALPPGARRSHVLSGNDLGLLGNVAALPDEEAVDALRSREDIKDILDATIGDPANRERELHELAKVYLQQNRTEEALQIVMLAGF